MPRGLSFETGRFVQERMPPWAYFMEKAIKEGRVGEKAIAERLLMRGDALEVVEPPKPRRRRVREIVGIADTRQDSAPPKQ